MSRSLADTWSPDRPETPGGSQTLVDDAILQHDPVDAAFRHKARLAVCDHAADKAEAIKFMEMLGLVEVRSA